MVKDYLEYLNEGGVIVVLAISLILFISAALLNTVVFTPRNRFAISSNPELLQKFHLRETIVSIITMVILMLVLLHLIWVLYLLTMY